MADRRARVYSADASGGDIFRQKIKFGFKK
jgi:hypothetical protein